MQGNKIKLKTIFILFIISYSTLCFSQLDTSFLPLKKDDTRSKLLFKDSEKILELDLKNYSGNYKDDFKRIYRQQKNQINSYYHKIYFNPAYESYLNRITNEIIVNNPSLINEYLRVFFVYNYVPNACNTGEGSIFINLGLLDILENESELAFIIGHEIAHQSQRHVNKSINELFDGFYSENYQHKLAEMQKLGLGRYNRFKEIVKNLELDNSRHSRNHESESDSLALEYLRNTSYNLFRAAGSLNKLKLADTELIDMNNILASTFHFENMPFNQRWLHKKESIGDKYKQELSKEVQDSLSTHPNTKERYRFIISLIQQNDPSQRDSVELSRDTFDRMKREFNYISIQKLIEEKEISKAIYQILKTQNNGDKSQYLQIKLLACLQTVYNKLNDYTLGEYVDNRNPYYPKEYNKLLIFLDNLSIKDLENIIENYKVNLFSR